MNLQLTPKDIDILSRMFKEFAGIYERPAKAVDVINEDINSGDGETVGSYTVEEWESLEARIEEARTANDR